MAMSQDEISDTVPIAGRELVIRRVFDAPRDLVWQAWTEPERLMQWWGPKDYIMNVSRLDLRPGGLFHYGMRSPDGREVWGRFAYIDVAAPEKLVFTNSFSDEAGGITRHPMSATWPLEVLNIFTFTESVQKTTLTMRGWPHHATTDEQKTFDENRENIKNGFIGTFEQLDEYLSAYINKRG
jgi:uncharacterized protein YndB with AHSA1/START domain